ncbi:DUF2251 domain-containing protein [Sorangium sp. So ce426]|uniref:DUF2251 domain-containing protein n=1 Tax=Sorangium sp. So ce426 TaxID=3133312 RepID=UPI003F5BD742
MDEIFDSAVRPAGDLAGVFEYDGDTGYFYLYATGEGTGQKVLDAIHVLSGMPDFGETDISIRWDSEEQKVGLFIKGILWAVYDCARRAKYGGAYKSGGKPSLPSGADVGF